VGIKTIGVLYGFGDEKELSEAGAIHIVKTPRELMQYLLE
jgi:phosphoglycolate phosphatase